MKNSALFDLASFLRYNLNQGDNLLLALSGGTDSLALFYLLLECQKQIPFKLGILHVDHGWREESKYEAEKLKLLAENHALPFYLKVLPSTTLQGNLESACREARLSFYLEICKQENYRAVLLGHQLEDSAETVLKKIFEGASLASCNGIRGIVTINGLEIWRPLLGISKKVLAEWLEIRGILPFTDKTNFDTKFLRARMRQKIIPDLEHLFGKGIVTTLASIGKESEELTEFLEHHLKLYLEKAVSGPLGTFLDLSDSLDLSLFEFKWIIRRLCMLERNTPSKEILEGASLHLKKGSFNKEFRMRNKKLFIDRGRIFILKLDFDFVPSRPVLLEKAGDFGLWQVKIEDIEEEAALRSTSWRALWSGRGEAVLPKFKDAYAIGIPEGNASLFPSGDLAKWFSLHQVPPFLRFSTPAIWKGACVCHEFLTGEGRFHAKKNACRQRITLILHG